MTWLTAAPPAKLNLFLEVTARRPDGYHDLDTVFVAVDWRDQLRIRPRDDDQIRLAITRDEVDWTDAAGTPEPMPIPTDDRNLVVAALRAFHQRFGGPAGWDAELVKSIPAGAGMGGASSDAASALSLAAEHVRIDRQSTRLANLALQIGSDVPFFVSGHAAAHATGRGQRLTELPMPDSAVGFVVVYPAAEISTGGVFGQCRVPAHPVDSQPLRTALMGGHWNTVGDAIVNRLQAPAVGGCPALRQALGWLESNTTERWWMTGSGSACFCMARSPADGQTLANRLRRHCPFLARVRWVCPTTPRMTANSHTHREPVTWKSPKSESN